MIVKCVSSMVPWFKAEQFYKAEEIMNSDRLSVYDSENDEFSDWIAANVHGKYIIPACDAWFEVVTQ
ncbi:hypothetical protein vBYenM531-1_06 [Yersinia phage vB_YenM_531]|nr:hypothetical protein vBYenM531-1_06 [Yersinia phage vB_YenM_531]QKN87441.1 hypothetical protein vBYenM281_006 [Yersinia phage vB_YenM_281]